MLKSLVAFTFCVLVPVSALADPYSDLGAVAKAFMSAKSFQATESFSNGRTVTVTYVAPDRWQINPTPQIQENIIGTDVYMHVGGRWMHMPLPSSLTSSLKLANHPWGSAATRSQVTIKSETRGTLNGAAVRIFTFTTQSSPGFTTTLSAGMNNLPLKAVVSGSPSTTITYSNYNQPFTIDAP